MCNHYRNNPEAIPTWAEYIGFRPMRFPEDAASDVYPRRPAAIVRMQQGDAMIEAATWGFERSLPGARPGTTRKTMVTNVRNLSSPYWAAMLKTPAQRCLVPFSQFAEPVIGGGRAEHWFTIRDRPLAAFAGIWRMTETGARFAFLTCEPNSLIAPLHPKAMPVILAEQDYAAWLNADWQAAQDLVQPFPSQLMHVGQG
jgi:putative SOS response-associated peptidase YedK